MPRLGYPNIGVHQGEDTHIHNFAKYGQIQKEGREGVLDGSALVGLGLGILQDTTDAVGR